MQVLSTEQRRQWQTDGYLHIEGVLDEEQVSFLSDEIDRIRTVPGWEPKNDPELPIGHYAWLDHATDLDPGGFMDRRDLLPYHQAFIDLVDAAPVFDYIVDIMGPNILLSMTQAVVPPIAMKAMFLLTDVPTGNCGNLTVFPGSHLRQIPYQGDRTMTPYSPGAAQLTGKAGDVYLFPHALWHGPSRNESGNARKVLLYNYCQLWVRCYDFGAIPDVAQRATPRQRRLLGDQEAVIRS